MSFKLQDIIDIEQFQMLQDRLNEIYSFPSAIIDIDGNILTATAWQDVCTKFHRQNPDCEKECIKSDQYILSHLHEANPAVSYKCPHGLVDNATPIIIDGVHYGNFFTGQFFLEAPDLNFFRAQALKYGFDEDAYIDAVKKVPIWSNDQLESYLYFIKGMIEVISGIGLKRLKEIELGQQLLESERRADAIIRQMLDAFWVTDINGRILDVNESMIKMTGYTHDELLKMSVADLEVNDTEEVIAERIQQIIQTGSAFFESKFQKKDGGIIDLEISVSYMPERKQFFAFHRDITERKRSEESLRQSELKLRTIYESSKDAIGVSKRGAHVMANPAYLELFGYSSFPEVEELLVPDLIAPDCREQVQNNIRLRASGNNCPSSYITRGLKKDGTEFDMDVNSTTYELDGEIYTLVLLRDITERLQMQKEKELLQAQLFQSQKMEAIGQIAGGMAHDFNNMLGVIMSATELAKMDTPVDSLVQEELGIITDSVKRAKDLTLKLLTFARRDKIEVKGVEAGAIIDNLYGMLKRTVPKSIAMKVNVDDKCFIKCDQNQIQQALVNVCNNAVDAMPSGGSIMIEAGEAEFPEGACQTCGQKLDGRYCRIQISDSGVGMTKDMLSKITEPFFTTKGIGKGTGLGLSVTQGIIASHKGHLHFYSEIDKGTCVKIYLPIDEGRLSLQEDRTEHKRLIGTETILIVDDEEVLLNMTGKMLEKYGYKTLLAESGVKAIDIYSEHKHEIAVVILDLMMPEMDGSEVNRRLKEVNPDVKIVLSSGFSINGMAEKLMTDKDRKFVQKPFEIITLCGAIRDLIGDITVK